MHKFLKCILEYICIYVCVCVCVCVCIYIYIYIYKLSELNHVLFRMQEYCLVAETDLQRGVHCEHRQRYTNWGHACSCLVRDERQKLVNYIGLINCRTQLICGTYMFIT
jgi:hypothetical protein